MLNWLIRKSLYLRPMVFAGALAIVYFGWGAFRSLPVEVLPDLTKPTVTIMTEAPGLAPEDVENLVTKRLEAALSGVSGVTRLRSKSDVALSLIYVEFDWGADIYDARIFVQERLQLAKESLPEGVSPFMTPVASLMGEIMLVGMRSPGGEVSGPELRSLADWDVGLRLRGIKGVAEVLNMGGGIRQLQIQPNPDRMQAMGVTFEEIETAAANSAGNSTGGFLTAGPKEIMVRNLAMTTDPEEIAKTVVKQVNDRPITIADVAEVTWGTEPMRGDAAIDGMPSVILSVTKSPGVDTIDLTQRIEKEIADIQTTLPDGVQIEALFRQSDFINHAVHNLKEAILHGGIFVAAILFLFLFNARTTAITLTAIPLSFCVTFLVFQWFEISVNSMTLGGLAVAIGMVVDDAIIDVENVYRRLRENASLAVPKPRLEVIVSASAEIRQSILYATIFVILVFVPLLALTGVEGRLFTPIAVATIVSMAASFVVSLTVIPVLCSYLLRPKIGKEHKDGFIVRGLKVGLKHTWLKLALSRPTLVFGAAAVLLAWAISLYPQMGKDFLPKFREETVLVATTTQPGTSLTQTNEITLQVEKLLMQIPEVRKVGARVGRAERGDHVVPVSTVEFDVDFVSSRVEKGFFRGLFDSLVGAHGDDGARSRADIEQEIRDTMRKIPGTFSVVSGPLADRVGHMLSGVSAKVAIKVFGPDLETLRKLGKEIQTVAQGIPGLEEAKVEQQALIPQIQILPDRERNSAYDIAPKALITQLSSLIGGKKVGELFEQERTIDLVLRLPELWRESPKKLEDMYVDTKQGRIPLRLVADIVESKGPNVIQREDGRRRFVVSINPTARDLSSLVTQLEQEINEKVKRPPGYEISVEGEFQAQQEATSSIIRSSLAVLCVAAFLLFMYFRSPMFSIQVLCDIPLALIGGLLLTHYMPGNNNISIATLVGFIAVTGIASRNSIMLISHYLHLMKHEGEGFTRKMIERGTLERLVPVLMTALSAGIALLPLVWAMDQPGKEILHPVAVVIVGGLITSTFLGLGVTPAVFYTFGRKAALRAVREGAPAAN